MEQQYLVLLSQVLKIKRIILLILASVFGYCLKDRIFQNDLEALAGADLTVALITGQDIDSGTCAEIGHTFASGKPVIAIDANERRYRNLFVEGMISQTVNDVDELLPSIKSLNI